MSAPWPEAIIAAGCFIAFVGLLILGICRAAAGLRYEDEQREIADAIAERRNHDFMGDHQFEWLTWDPRVEDLRATNRADAADTARPMTRR